MKRNDSILSKSISRRSFLKNSLALGAASAIHFSFPRLLHGQSSNSLQTSHRIDGFIDPYGLAIDSSGLIYVTDAGSYCIKVFDAVGKLVQTIGRPGSSGDRLNYPQGIAVDANGDIYVVDSNNGRIVIFSPEGKFIGSIGEVGGYPDAFYTPKGIFVGDKIYACNTRNHRLSVFDKNSHQLIGSFGDLGDDPKDLPQGTLAYHFRLPTGVAVSADGRIYVVDSKHGEIKVLDPNGQFLFRFGENGSGPGQLNLPEGIALDRTGNVYVCDSINGRIQKFDPQGQFLGMIKEGLKRPTSIAITSDNKCYVVDAELKQVIQFEWTA
ncbi:MAG: SMP-30/gluconolactonase/LRE family protein [candidate division KSB1 bacterium]|nr:SMP-30/gluconolactonase/LRE family protein [candidate division KSB1 bacterium]